MRKRTTFMEADEILAQARKNPQPPHGWIILPLLRRKVAIGIAGWTIGMLLGLGLFAAVASIVIPANYQHGPLAAVFTTLLLGILLFIGLGSFWTLITDVRRLQQVDTYLIVVTPEDFVKQEGAKIVHVPLANVCYVTARGKAPPDPTPAKSSDIPSVGEGIAGFFFGRGFAPSGTQTRRKRMRTPTSLAFIDTRTDKEVTVVTDEAYGDPFMIAAFLKQYAAAVQQ